MWKYGLKHHVLDDNTDWYELAEIYDIDSDVCYTEDNLIISGTSKEQVIEMLKIILEDLENDCEVIEMKDK